PNPRSISQLAANRLPHPTSPLPDHPSQPNQPLAGGDGGGDPDPGHGGGGEPSDDDSFHSDDSDHEPDPTPTPNLAEAIVLMTRELKRRDKNTPKRTKAREPDTFDGSDPRKLNQFILQCKLSFSDNDSYKSHH